ncbi:hypothetical protein [Phormidium sp. CCY1219]|uniref:hypothetical protein n=1 Tax=Phormidium sp. CCY1219 TaxID=2886104 RepID=UPI002D1F64EB|nr:hypothetical protein [Phormidium sp. CCY1219]MEB3829632.1 hypothetical protein [Phormidium sp. CCY1219]
MARDWFELSGFADVKARGTRSPSPQEWMPQELLCVFSGLRSPLCFPLCRSCAAIDGTSFPSDSPHGWLYGKTRTIWISPISTKTHIFLRSTRIA